MQAIGALLGAWLLYATIISPLTNRNNSVTVVRQPEPVRVVTPAPEPVASKPVGKTRQRIINLVPTHYDLFHQAAEHALKSEESCKGINDTNAETFAWGL